MAAPGSPLANHVFSVDGDEQWLDDLPKISPEDHFVDVVRELSMFVTFLSIQRKY
jgi:hypothetical protein